MTAPLSSRPYPLTDAERELRSITNFVMAGVGVGKVRRQEEYDKFDQTGESGYGEGYAEGFLRAMQLVADFIEKKEGQ